LLREYQREHHQRIARVLASMNPEFLLRNEAFFGGGTAIALLLDEYRISVDIDFMVASKAGYKALRESVFDHGLKEFFVDGLVPDQIRELRADSDGVRTAFVIDGLNIKFEVVRESRIALTGAIADFAVPSLSRVSLFAEKLLANADRGNAADSQKKDILDLLTMQMAWGAIPDESIQLAAEAYSYKVIQSAYDNAMSAIADYHLAEVFVSLGIQGRQRGRIISAIESGVYARLLPAGASQT